MDTLTDYSGRITVELTATNTATGEVMRVWTVRYGMARFAQNVSAAGRKYAAKFKHSVTISHRVLTPEEAGLPR